jgi:hypothetical protein
MSGPGAIAHGVIAVALAVGVVVAACGGEKTRLSASEYRRQAGESCETLKDASTELAKAQEASATGPKVTRYVGAASDRLRDLVGQLDGLDPPRALAHDAGRLVDLLGGYASGLDQLARKVGPRDTLTDTFRKNQRLVTKLNRDAGAATALVAKLRLTDCLLS